MYQSAPDRMRARVARTLPVGSPRGGFTGVGAVGGGDAAIGGGCARPRKEPLAGVPGKPSSPPGAVPGPMTFSIVARDPMTKDLGVAVESKFPAVGMAVPWARAGVGAIATQSWAI